VDYDVIFIMLRQLRWGWTQILSEVSPSDIWVSLLGHTLPNFENRKIFAQRAVLEVNGKKDIFQIKCPSYDR
jgi:hypothetical protein